MQTKQTSSFKVSFPHCTVFCSIVLWGSYQNGNDLFWAMWAILSLPIFLMKEKEKKEETTAFDTQLFKDKLLFFQSNEFFYAKVNRKRCRKFRKSCCSHRTELKKLSFRPSWVCKQITIPIGNLVVSINHINTSCFKGDLMSESFSISQKMCQIHNLAWSYSLQLGGKCLG